MEVGDVLTVELPHASGTSYEWTIYMEAIEGNPTLIDSEEVEEPQEDMPGAPYVHRFILEAAAPGAVKVDFTDQNQLDQSEPPQTEGSTIVRIS
jgi:predicted secreted protein